MHRGILATALYLAACGPAPTADDGDDGDDQASPDAYAGAPAELSGTVWMPGQSPGLAAPGEEVPVFGALVYVTRSRPDPIPQEVYCERCVDAPGNAVYSGHDGGFQLSAPPGDYWLVIQKGQWRIEREVTLTAGPIALSDAETTLPTVHDPDAGSWVPRIAIVLGTNDNVEDILGKVGLGNFDASTNDFLDGGGEVTIIDSAQGALSDLDLLRQFHIVFFPCNVNIDDDAVAGLDDQALLANLRRYVSEGGKLYVTDWSGEMMDRPFPPQIELGGDVPGFTYYDSKGSYDPQTFTGTLTQLGSANNSSYTSNDAEVVDPDLSAWLGLQLGPSPIDPTPMMFDPDHFTVTGNYNWISALSSVETGVDQDGLPIVDEPKPWVIGSRGPSAPAGKHPLSVTFEPTGCGRVMYSTYQTANGHHAGLYPQERVLLYLIMEIAVCSDVPVVE